jgi:hypothetical protein
MSKTILKILLAGGLIILMVSGVSAEVNPTSIWTCFYGTASSYNGNPIPVGSIVDAYDTSGVHCGTVIVHTAGQYGCMSVYGKDDYGDGAEAGETISLYINGIQATPQGPDNPIWSSFGDRIEVNLTATAEVSMMFVNRPDDGQTVPGGTVRYYATVRNTGEGTDFYHVTATTEHGWIVEPKPELTYALPGEDAVVYFDVWAPYNIYIDADEAVYFSVVSGADPSVFVDDTVVTHVLIPTDAPDDSHLMPGSFELYQNFPNPFNPTTTIAFNLPGRSETSIEIFNLLGQTITAVDLGGLDAGYHTFEYDASDLASGVYFYRVKAGELSDIKKMILLK